MFDLEDHWRRGEKPIPGTLESTPPPGLYLFVGEVPEGLGCANAFYPEVLQITENNELFGVSRDLFVSPSSLRGVWFPLGAEPSTYPGHEAMVCRAAYLYGVAMLGHMPFWDGISWWEPAEALRNRVGWVLDMAVEAGLVQVTTGGRGYHWVGPKPVDTD